MYNDFEFNGLNIVLIILIVIGLIAVKFYYFRILRPGSNIKRFLKSCFRWYGSNERDLTYDHLRKRKFMVISNWINIPLWFLFIALLIKISLYLIEVFPDIN